MKITKKKEAELIAHLSKGYVSVPELQIEMNVSYKEARSLLDYAIEHKWIKGRSSGNKYLVIASDFARKDLPTDTCKKIYTKLGYDDLKVLFYLGKRFSATLLDILENVDDEEEDMRNALNKLLGARLIFKHEESYYCKISRKSIKLIQQNGNENDADDSMNYHRFLRGLK